MKHKSVLDSPRLSEMKIAKRKVLKRKVYFSLAGFLVALTSLACLSRWKNLNINNVEAVGNKVITEEQIKSIVKEKIDGNYFLILPKSNFSFYPREEIEEELRTKFKRIGSLSLKLKDLQTLEISLTERTPLYTWCGVALKETEILMLEENACYFIDESGYVFDKAPYFSGDVYTKLYGNIEMHEGDPMGYYFKIDTFQKIVSYKETLQKVGLKISSFQIEDNQEIKVFLSSAQKTGPMIIFKQTDDFEHVIENLQASLTTEPLLSNFKKKYSKLEYIDLRFGNKVYYKFND